MQAILIGQSFQLQRSDQQYRSTGTSHALVISGTRRRPGRVFPPAAHLLRPRKHRALRHPACGLALCLVTGWQTPCVRSAAGLTLYMIGGYLPRTAYHEPPGRGRARLSHPDPEQLFDASFQLTFLAVGFLGAFARDYQGHFRAALARPLTSDTGRDLHLAPRIAQFRVEMRLLAKPPSRDAAPGARRRTCRHRS